MPPRMINGMASAHFASFNVRSQRPSEKCWVERSYPFTRFKTTLVRTTPNSTSRPGISAATNRLDDEMPSTSPRMM